MGTPSYHHVGGTKPLLGATLADWIGGVARRHPAHEAVVSLPQRRRLTYRALLEETDRVARGLLALGLERGDRMGVWATDNVEWLLLQTASARVGAVLVNVNPANTVRELAHVLASARMKAMFLMPSFRTSRYADMMRSLVPALDAGTPDTVRSAEHPELAHVVVFDPDDPDATARPAPGFLTWSEVLARGAGVDDDALMERAAELDPDDPINIQFTSGTTGFPKPVLLTHHNVLNNAWSIGEILRLGPEDRVCVPVPFYHCFGMVVSNLACLARGATIVIPAPHFEAGATLDAVAEERCTVLHGVPTMFVAELDAPGRATRDLRSLRTGIMAGAPCPPELVRRVMEELGCREILIGYGQTEASPVTHLTRPDDPFARRVGSVGTNLPHQEAKVVDPATGAMVPAGTEGELCFRGYHVMRGYFEMPEKTRETIDEAGWLHSGDLAVMAEDGYVRITGRLKDMIIRGGEKVYPAEIEAFLFGHPLIAQVAVFGVPDPRWGEKVAAWVQLHPGARMGAEELREFARSGLAHYKVPEVVRFVDAFPMTVTGKIQKFRMQEHEAAARPGPARATAP